MGLVDPSYKPLTSDEARDQLKACLAYFSSEDRITSGDTAVPMGRNGPFVRSNLPLRQLCELALKGLDSPSCENGDAKRLDIGSDG